MNRLLFALAPAAAALAVSVAASAQPPGPPAEGGRRVVMMRGGPDGHGGAGLKAMHEAMQKQRLEDLKTILRIRPDQEAALKAFVESGHGGGPVMIRREMKADGAAGHMTPPKAMTTPERLAAMAKHEEAMTAQRKTRRDALAKFYAALSPDQQKVFDALQRMHGPGRGHGPGMRRIEIRRGGPGGHAGHGPD